MNQIQEVEKKTFEEYLEKIKRDQLIGRFIAKGFSPQDAEDITQITLHNALKGFSTYDPKKGSFENWISRIATNAMRTFVNGKYRKTEVVMIDIGPEDFNYVSIARDSSTTSDARCSAQLGDLHKLMGDQIEKLTKIQKKVILAHLQGISPQQAESMGLVTSKRRFLEIRRDARERIKKGLQRKGIEESDIF